MRRILDVIEISSSDSENSDVVPRQKTASGSKTLSGSRTPAARTPRKKERSRRIVYSSSSSDDDHDTQPTTSRRPAPKSLDVIEITSSSDASDDETWRPKGKKTGITSKLSTIIPPSRGVADDGILELNEPSSARKPVRKAAVIATPQVPKTPGKSRAQKQANSTLSLALTASRENTISLPPSTRTTASKVPEPPRTPKRNPASSTPAKTPRTSKKAAALAAQTQREVYAQELFDELNKTVFGEGIPAGTKLVWSNRLLTTAGRARWHRSKDGVHTTEIELATKILDCNERIRNTLSHEMCHLACWIINKEPKEAHGRYFKSWAAKVMRKRPEIEITTRHDYEISYRYEWKCEKCSKIYGRHSKSIRIDEVVCGACRIGKLIPLFAVRPKASGAPKTPSSKLASASGKARGECFLLQFVIS
ncbi:hypothetical protein DENSPDRAFT_616267 [Dentipellis sp. KUC8613]|nr:hypothetical protein DENSPDRAFT_616267 [Dentipellis sp. KUC8613]